jgi:ABC-type nitrate/sulfonate/bicarbonate transport system substrate-binding protein
MVLCGFADIAVSQQAYCQSVEEAPAAKRRCETIAGIPLMCNPFRLARRRAMMAALEKGGIDAAVLTEPTFFIAEDLGYRVLADLADMDIYYLHSMIDTTGSYLRSHRDFATRFIK